MGCRAVNRNCPVCGNAINGEDEPVCPECAKYLARAEAGLPCRFEAIACLHAKARQILMRRLAGKIFHISDAKGFLGIIAAGKIEANQDGRFGNHWGNKESYFKNLGCISVCDFYNNTRPKKLYDAICKYNFYDLSCNKGLSYLMVLQDGLYAGIITWDRWKQDRETGGDVVPHLESGYPGEISLCNLESIIKVHIEDHFDEDIFFNH